MFWLSKIFNIFQANRKLIIFVEDFITMENNLL